MEDWTRTHTRRGRGCDQALLQTRPKVTFAPAPSFPAAPTFAPVPPAFAPCEVSQQAYGNVNAQANQNSIEYRYKTSGVYQYELIITDFAGNQFSQTGVLALTFNSGLEDDSASSFGVFIFFIVFIALITSWVWGPKLSENFSFDTIKNLFNKK